jgi:hypothetical protein
MDTNIKTYQVAECASGCAFHSTAGGTCSFCGGPLTAPVAMTREQALDTFRHESDGKYAAGKAAVLAWMAARR